MSGRWSGRRIVLELSAAPEGGYQGTLTLRKRKLPITVRRGLEGWVGTLVQGEVEAEFSLAREERAVVMVSDGRTYRLEPALEVEEGVSWVGSYRGPHETSLSVELDRGAGGYSGSLVLEGVRYVLKGRRVEAELQGALRDPLTGKELSWRASEVSEGGLLFTIRLEQQDAEGRASYHALRFERAKQD